ncbi:MAG TPA: adenylyltransferase/cytidyltransferase family protein [Cryomorphaceae bacterium]|nr:adenylyltransferase/cytidyltransferase family protein [Cryomorphaceae bacterium]
MSRLDRIAEKIVPIEKVEALAHRLRIKGKRIIFTNGVFDILHRGHVTLLNLASEQGDFLIVGLNSDDSVRTLGKGPERPLNAEEDRAMVLAALQCVDAVVIFGDSTPYELVKLIRPDVLVKGGDYDPDQDDPTEKEYIVGSDIQRETGKSTISIPLVEGYSTTAIIKKSKNG